MHIYLLYSLLILLSLVFTGSLFTVHMKKNNVAVFYSPWIGAIYIVNIGLLANFSKIPISKTVFNTPFFNGIAFIIATIFLTAIVSFLQAKNRNFGFRKKDILLYVFYWICIVVFTAVFFNKLGDVSAGKRAGEIKTLSLADEMFVKKHIQNSQWQVGIPVLISVYSDVFKISPFSMSKIIQGIFIVLLAPLVAYLIMKIVKRKKNNTSFFIFLAIFVGLILIFQIRGSTLDSVFITGMILLIANLTLDYSHVLAEEFILAQAFIYLAAINSNVFKLALIVFLLMTVSGFFNRKKHGVLIFIKPIFLMIILNPLLVGFALRF